MCDALPSHHIYILSCYRELSLVPGPATAQWPVNGLISLATSLLLAHLTPPAYISPILSVHLTRLAHCKHTTPRRHQYHRDGQSRCQFQYNKPWWGWFPDLKAIITSFCPPGSPLQAGALISYSVSRLHTVPHYFLRPDKPQNRKQIFN